MDKPHFADHFLDELMVVLVIYKMKIDESPAFLSLTEALKSSYRATSIFIYDNSPNAHQSTLPENWRITYRTNPSNPGVSKAYNQGFELAKTQNKKWLLLVDQDTIFPADAFEKYRLAIEESGCSIIIPLLLDEKGIVSPLKFYLGGGRRLTDVSPDQVLSLRDYFFHNSGLLLAVDAFERAGKYDENIPLDFSDFAFIYRLRKRNSNFVAANIVCKHRLATTSNASINERQLRFQSYLEAGRYFKKYYRPLDWMLTLRLLLRAFKLAFQYRNFKFIVLYFR
jgi:GT2 family glycosyltransferase